MFNDVYNYMNHACKLSKFNGIRKQIDKYLLQPALVCYYGLFRVLKYAVRLQDCDLFVISLLP